MQSIDKRKKLMAKKRYKTKDSTPIVSEPALAYQTDLRHSAKTSHKVCMTVDEYFDKVKKALDRRYEELRRQDS